VLVPSGKLVAVFAWPPLQWVGRRSYGIYLYHYPFAVAFVEGRHLHGLHYAVVVIACVSTAIVLAAASFRWVETPFLRRKDRLAAIGESTDQVGSVPRGAVAT